MANTYIREEFLASLTDVPDVQPARMTLHQMTRNGAIGEKELEDVGFLRIMTAELPNEERTQYHQNPIDSGKVHFFGRTPRIYSFSCFIVDSDLLNHQGINYYDLRFKGQALRAWLIMYEDKLRLSKCLKANQIVRIRWRTSEVFGYILGQARSHESTNPGIYSIGLTLLALVEHDTVDIVQYLVGGGDGGDKRSIEGLASTETLSGYLPRL